MKWSISFALIGVVALLTVFARVDNESPTSSTPQTLIEVEIDQLVLTRLTARAITRAKQCDTRDPTRKSVDD